MPASDQETFLYRLHRDVDLLYREGLEAASEPLRIPALAELSQHLYEGSSTTRQAVKETLDEVAGYTGGVLVPLLTKVSHTKIVEGLKELFGLCAHSPDGIEARRDLAGPKFGYRSGNSWVKRATPQGIPLMDAIVDETTKQLVILAEKAGFTYSAKYGVGRSPTAEEIWGSDPMPSLTGRQKNYVKRKIREPAGGLLRGTRPGTYMQIWDPEETDPMVTPPQEAEAQSLSEVLARELRRLIQVGWDSSTHFPVLHAFAVSPACPRVFSWRWDPFRLPRPSPPFPENHLEGLLLMVVDTLEYWAQVEISAWDIDPVQAYARIQGAIELLGLGERRELTLQQRRDRAAPYFECNAADLAESPEEATIVDKLCLALVRLAISRRFIPLPDDARTWQRANARGR